METGSSPTKLARAAIRLLLHNLAVRALNSGALTDCNEPTIGIHLANAAGNRAMFGECVVKPVASHCKVGALRLCVSSETGRSLHMSHARRNRQH